MSKNQNIDFIARLREKSDPADPDLNGVLAQIEQNLARGDPSIRYECLVPVDGSNGREPIREALFLNGRENVSIYNAARAVYGNGEKAAALFDAIFFILVVDDKKTPGVRTVNISPMSACSPYFWKLVDPVLEQQGRSNFIFEIIEYGDGLSPDGNHIRVLEKAKEKGCRFALDDVSGPEDERLNIFGPYVEMLKIDGHTYIPIRGRGNVAAELGKLIREIELRFAENSKDITGATRHRHEIVVEFADSEKEAAAIKEAGAHFIQGRNLGPGLCALTP